MQRTSVVLSQCHVADADRDVLLEDAAVWVDDGTIRAVGPRERVLDQLREELPGEDRPPELELGGRTVMPGLFNMHTHLSLALPGPLGAQIAAMTPHELALYMADGARRSLLCGVTSVRCVAESDHADFALRAAIEAGRAEGPRMFTAGRALVCTGGHGHETSSTLECDGADDFRRGVRAQIRAGADLIKVMISGGIAGEHESIDTRQLTSDEMSAVISTAHEWNRKVTAHAGPAPVILEAVELGLDCVEHGYQLTPETAAAMARHGCALVPTLGVSRCREFFESLGVPPWMQERALGAGPRHVESYRTALDAGVPVMLGSDLPPFWDIDGTNATAWEYGLMAEHGAGPRGALAAATTVPAAWLGVDDRVGTVGEGKEADLLVVDGDPLTDASAVRRVSMVLQRGRVVPGAGSGATTRSAVPAGQAAS
ncbi:amidohydrolase family protein [Blastococcus sp. SYSU DS0619]